MQKHYIESLYDAIKEGSLSKEDFVAIVAEIEDSAWGAGIDAAMNYEEEI